MEHLTWSVCLILHRSASLPFLSLALGELTSCQPVILCHVKGEQSSMKEVMDSDDLPL